MKKSLWLPLAAGVLLTSGCGTKQEIAATGTLTVERVDPEAGTLEIIVHQRFASAVIGGRKPAK